LSHASIECCTIALSEIGDINRIPNS
jgi:hypothetical protein